MRQYLVAGNWKMNGSRSMIDALVTTIKAGIGGNMNTEVAVCPPFVFLDHVGKLLAGSSIALGAQNVCDQDSGAFTGEISGPMLVEIGCSYVIIGHSERRHIYGESDTLIAKRFAATRRAGLKPILCVGETLDERERGVTEQVVAAQLDAVIAEEGIEGLKAAVLAYEPVWAIGTGKTATPEQAQAVHAFIRKRIAGQDAALAGELRILYGGSVKGANAKELFAQEDIDGGLIGGASLNGEEFLTICRAAS